MDSQWERNQLLAMLPPSEKRMLGACTKVVTLQTKQELNLVGSPLRHLYFPLDAAISVMGMEQSGRVLEVAVVGKEGCFCPDILNGLTISPTHTIVQIGGQSLRVDAASLTPKLLDLPIFSRMVRRFSASLFRHAVISVGCSQWHSVEQRLARWLLAHHHRTSEIVFPFTHEFLADQLGSQRVTVSEALSAFQRNDLVRYSYGKVELVNVQKLEHVSCECFDLATQAIDEYLRDIRTYSR
ncbi:MAG TPA: Crp/Fnr family transcriptional regulator [Nitrospira sp.]|nr:Crp/Fnr family transcriptional regulator [Nitrospira sp.]